MAPPSTESPAPETADAWISARLADSWSTTGLHDALQVIADGIREIAGFEVSAVAVLRDDDRFEFIAISGEDPDLQALLGESNPRDQIYAEVAKGDDWGVFSFVPASRRTGSLEAQWTPPIEESSDEEAWHPHDLMVALLTDSTGTVRGLLSVDVPISGRRPTLQQRTILNSYARQAGRVLSNALGRHQLEQQLRLSQTARQVVRAVNPREGVEFLIQHCGKTIKTGFSLDELWIFLTTEDGLPSPYLVDSRGGRELLPIATRELLTQGMHEAFRNDTAMLFFPDFEDEQSWGVWRERLRNSKSFSILMVPVADATNCFGCLLMARAASAGAWDDDEIETAMEIGRDLGQAIVSARLHERDRELVQRLERLDEHKRGLIATMAHEFKNPIAAVAGHAELLDPVVSDPRGIKSLASINRSTTRMLKLVEDLLYLSRVTQPGYPLEMDSVDLNFLVRETLDVVSVQAESRDQEIKTTLEYPGARAWGDAQQLGLLVTNLVSNALKYSPDGASVQVDAVTDESGDVVIRVKDDGIGISEADQLRLFEEFYRSDNPEAHSRSGTGLGLAIVKGIVERHDGSIQVDSQLGVGTTFTVRLPAPPSPLSGSV